RPPPPPPAPPPPRPPRPPPGRGAQRPAQPVELLPALEPVQPLVDVSHAFPPPVPSVPTLRDDYLTVPVCAACRALARAWSRTTSSASRTDSLSRASKVISGTPSSMAKAHLIEGRSWATAPSNLFTATTNGNPSRSK